MPVKTSFSCIFLEHAWAQGTYVSRQRIQLFCSRRMTEHVKVSKDLAHRSTSALPVVVSTISKAPSAPSWYKFYMQLHHAGIFLYPYNGNNVMHHISISQVTPQIKQYHESHPMNVSRFHFISAHMR